MNRGLAILGDKVFLGLLDAHVIALDAKTGNVVWDAAAVDYAKGYSFTLAPLVLKNLVILGVSGGEYGIRGFIDAYDAETGKRKWLQASRSRLFRTRVLSVAGFERETFQRRSPRPW